MQHIFPPLTMLVKQTKPPFEFHSNMATMVLQKWVEVALKVEEFKKGLKDATSKIRGDVTKFMSQNKAGQEFPPPIGKYVDLFKAEPLHNTNNAWQYWFSIALAIAMQYTNQNSVR